MADRSGSGPPADSDAQDIRARIYDDVILEWYRYPPGPAGTIPSHSHEEYQLCLCFGSASRYRYRRGWIVVPSGTMSVLMPDEVHTASEAEDRQELTQYRVLYAGADQLREVATAMGSHRSGMPFFADAVLCDDDLSKRFLRLCVAFEGASAQLGRDIGLLSMLGALVRRHARTPDVRQSLTGPRRAVQIARAYLEDNYAANVSLRELEQVTALSPFHLARLFQQEVGMPPHAYQIQVRIAHAKRLLLRGLPVSRVASESGFFDLSHFSRHFKRLVGVAPGRYADDRKNVHYGAR
jgi:AraC-like DNA-binding protein